jgi:hypothetical protein
MRTEGCPRGLIVPTLMTILIGAPGAPGLRLSAIESHPAPPSICIGIVTPSVQGTGPNAAEFGVVVRDLFAGYLAGPSIQAMPLKARLASQAMEEAKQQNCGHVLTATLTRKRGGQSVLGKVVGQAGSTAAWYIPGGATATSAVTRGVAVATAHAVASFAATTRARDELRLEYRVVSPDGTVQIPARTEKLKARADGDDLLTPLVEKASEAIVGTLLK